MEFFLDTASIDDITELCALFPITGVTTNPSILLKDKANFWPTLTNIRRLIGERQLHVQVTGTSVGDIEREADAIVSRLGHNTYIKIPVNMIGLQAISLLKDKGYYVTGTAIYFASQAILAAQAGADYIAPYFNRMNNNGVDASATIKTVSKLLIRDKLPCKILGASFKNTNQLVEALESGAQAVTASPELMRSMVTNPLIEHAILNFNADWTNANGTLKIFGLD